MGRSARTLAVIAVLTAAATLAACTTTPTAPAGRRPASAPTGGRWISGDAHTHTLITDGSFTQAQVAQAAFETYGLGWFANAEHGGRASHDASGNVPSGVVWRWDSLVRWSWPAVTATRRAYPDKLLVQGLEWEMPGYDAASLGIISGEPTSVASFEYAFDARDESIEGPAGAPAKDNASADAAVRAVSWLASRYPDTSYVLLNHPSRSGRLTPGGIRALLDAGGEAIVGFEGIPGHQRAVTRGEYRGQPSVIAPRPTGRTRGGADPMLAEVGGVWDSLLCEGRRLSPFADSDFHGEASDFWPGQYARTWTRVAEPAGYRELVAGLKSGRTFCATGGLVDGLRFSVASDGRSVEMGDAALRVRAGADVTVTVAFRSPGRNANGDEVRVDHVDVIGSDVTTAAAEGTAAREAGSADARILASFGDASPSGGIRDRGDGWREFTWVVRDVRQDLYLRLRGTNLARDVPGQTDAEGDPLPDATPNDEAEAWKDLWFYSSPVWIDVR